MLEGWLSLKCQRLQLWVMSKDWSCKVLMEWVDGVWYKVTERESKIYNPPLNLLMSIIFVSCNHYH